MIMAIIITMIMIVINILLCCILFCFPIWIESASDFSLHKYVSNNACFVYID